MAKATDFLKTRLLDTLSDQIRKIQKVRESERGEGAPCPWCLTVAQLLAGTLASAGGGNADSLNAAIPHAGAGRTDQALG